MQPIAGTPGVAVVTASARCPPRRRWSQHSSQGESVATLNSLRRTTEGSRGCGGSYRDVSEAAILCRRCVLTTIPEVSLAEPEPLVSREEVVAMLFNIADIASEAETIRRLLEETGEEKED